MSDKPHQKSKRISKVLQSFTKEDMHQLGVTTTTTPLIRLDNNNSNNNNNGNRSNNNIQQQQQSQNDFHHDDMIRSDDKGNTPHIHTDLGFSQYHKNLIDSTMNAAAASQNDRSRGQQLIYLYPLTSPREGYPSPTEMSANDNARYATHPNLSHHHHQQQQPQQQQSQHHHHPQQQQQQPPQQYHQQNHHHHPQQQQQQHVQHAPAQVHQHQQQHQQQPPPQQHPSQSPSVEGYYTYSPQVFYSPQQNYYSGSRTYAHIPNVSPYFPMSPHQGTFFPPQSNGAQNPVTIYVPSSPYQSNTTSNFTGIPTNDSYPPLLSTNEAQFPYSNNNQRQPVYSTTPNIYIAGPPTPPTPTRRSPSTGTRNGLQQQQQQQQQQQRNSNTNGSKKSKNKSKPVEQNLNTLNTYHGRILEIAVDQARCRELQVYLRDGGSDGTSNYSPSQVLLLIFDDICQQAFPIVVNPFGNYLFQKVYEYANHEQRVHLLHALSPRLADASCNKHGSRCVQDMIKNSLEYPDLINIIVQTLIPQILRLCVDENGNHVVQFCLEKLTVEQNSFIFNLIIERCLDICKQRYGNRVMQKCIKCAVEGQCMDFTSQIVEHSLELITDEFGNYIIQHMLQTCPQHIHSICCAVVGSITILSKQKHASVVIEKCFQSAGYDVQRRYLEEIILLDNLQNLIEDQFGNYVIQNALKYLPSDLKHKLVEHLLKFIDVIKQMPWGLQIISKMCSDSAIMSPSSQNNNSQTPTATVPNSSL